MEMRVYKNNKGNAVLEFALVLPLLLLILFGITEFGRAIMTTNTLNSAAREGARLAAVSPLSDSLAVRARIMEVLDAANVVPSGIDVQYLPADLVRVRVATDFQILSAGVIESFVGSIELAGATVMRYEL
jgi:hypothetical protein